MATITGVAGVGQQGIVIAGLVTLPASIWYTRDTGTLGYSAVTKWATGASIPPGTLRRQNSAPAVGNERVFVAIQSATGTTGGTEPTWGLGKGATTTDNTVTWMEATGQAGMNGDLTNCPNWTAASGSAINLGYVIQNNAGTFLFICTTPGIAGSGVEPTWNTTAGQTTADNSVTWTSIGAVGNFGNWAAPHARLANVFAATWSAAGDTIYIGNDHAETSAAITGLTSRGTASAPIIVYSVPTGTIPPVAVAVGASITFTTGGTVVIFGANNTTFVYGCSFTCPASLTWGIGAAILGLYFESCTFKTTSGATNVLLTFGSISGGASSHRFNLRNCTFIMNNASQSVRLSSGLTDFIGCTFFGTGTVPTTAFTCSAGQMGSFRIRNSDLSRVVGNLVNVSPAASGDISFENCKLGAGVAITTGAQAGQGGIQVRVCDCDSIGTNYQSYWTNYMGIVQDSTTVYRVRGASDGFTPISWHIISTANTKPLLPFVSQEIFIWNRFSGISRTATICLTSASVLTSADVWIELEYPGSATSPLGTSVLTRAALLDSGTVLTTDASSTWTGGLGNNYQIATSFTAQMVGVVKCRVCIGTPSITINVDPLITMS